VTHTAQNAEPFSVSQDLFGTLLNRGTLFVQTADAQLNMRMTLLVRAPYWKQYIDDNATLGTS